jgi:hypothetical protein
MSRLLIAIVPALVACGSDHALVRTTKTPPTAVAPGTTPPAEDPGGPGPRDPGTDTTPATAPEVLPSVPCSLSPDQARLDGCADGPFAATVDGHGYDTVQGAIDAAGAGETVVVCPGRWLETVEIDGGKHLEAADPTPGATVLDADGAPHAIDAGADAVLVGLGATGANQGGVPHGGGTLELRCATIANNDGGYSGGGIATFGTLVISESMISGNTANYSGAGIDAVSAKSVTISDSTFLLNDSGYQGGGLDVGNADTTLTRVTFDHNHADNDGGGMRFGDFAKGTLTVADAVFVGNRADHGGGAMSLGTFATDAIEITGSTFDGNHADADGGAIVFAGGVDATIAASSFTGNDANKGGAIEVVGQAPFGGGSLRLDDVTFESNTGSTDAGALGTDQNSAAVTIVGTNVVAHRNAGGAGAGAVVLWSDDALDCTGCDFGDAADDNTPADAVKAGSAYDQLAADFTL